MQRNLPMVLIRWIICFLTDRSMSVRIQTQNSTPRLVTSGIPQGSILGPLLFLLYTDDVDQILEPSVSMYKFADDMKIYHLYDPKTATSEYKPLQNCLNKLDSWCTQNHLPLNYNKCCVVHFGRDNKRASYQIGQCVLASRPSERDLGVVIDERLSFQCQVDSVVNRARRLVALMLHAVRSRSVTVIMPLYKSLIRPLLEYACAVWNPHLLKQIKQLESVQRYVTKRITCLSTLPYVERLAALQLPSLSSRRDYFDILEMYKILRGATISDVKFTLSDRHSRGHALKLRPDKFKSNVRKSALFVRAVNKWNALPPKVVDAVTVSGFKLRLKQHLHHL